MIKEIETDECQKIMAVTLGKSLEDPKLDKKKNINYFINHFNENVKILKNANKNWFTDTQIMRLFINSIKHIDAFDYWIKTAMNN